MQEFVKLMKGLGVGIGIGLVGVLAAWVIGLFSAEGAQASKTSTVLALESIVCLVLLGSALVTVHFGRLFHFNLQEESYERRSSMIPALLGLAVTVLLAYLYLAPYPGNAV